jgi:hypothetical protein
VNDSSDERNNNLLDLINRRIRPQSKQPGTIGFDELGNAQYQWQDKRMLEESSTGELRRKNALAANLALIDDEPSQHRTFVPLNKHGMRLGYNPYDSGQLSKQQTGKRVDLRELSKRIEASRRQK